MAVTRTTSSLLSLLSSPRGAEIFILGTAHVSDASNLEVRRVVEAVKPQTVMVELCAERAAILRGKGAGGPTAFPHFDDPMMQKVSEAVQKFGFANGNDMLAAMLAADEVDARIEYGDLKQEATMAGLKAAFAATGGFPGLMARASTAPPPPQSLVTLSTEAMRSMDIGKTVEAFKNRETVRDLKNWVRGPAPELMAALLDRRDDHMFGVLEKVAERSLAGRLLVGNDGSGGGPSSPAAAAAAAGGSSATVAVVGVAHMDGLEERWAAKYGDSSVHPVPSF